MTFEAVVEWIGYAIDGVGVGVIALGILLATAKFLRTRIPVRDRYPAYRQDLGRAILLGLEFLVAGDIIRTVAVSPTVNSLVVLAGIVLIRSFLSLALEIELEGRLPWRRQNP